MGFWDVVMGEVPGGGLIKGGLDLVSGGGGNGGKSQPFNQAVTGQGPKGHTYQGNGIIADPNGQQWEIVRSMRPDNSLVLIRNIQNGATGAFSYTDLPVMAQAYVNSVFATSQTVTATPLLSGGVDLSGRRDVEASMLPPTGVSALDENIIDVPGLIGGGISGGDVIQFLLDPIDSTIQALTGDPNAGLFVPSPVETPQRFPLDRNAPHIAPDGQLVTPSGRVGPDGQNIFVTPSGGSLSQFEQADNIAEQAFPDAFLVPAGFCGSSPKGYVIVRDRLKRRWFMKRDLAKQKKLFKARKRAPILASEMACLSTAKRVVGKVDKIFKSYGTKPKTRRAPTAKQLAAARPGIVAIDQG